MHKASKDYGPSLLQNDPAKEALLEKMRDKLARNVPAAKVREIQRKSAHNRTALTWGIRIVLGILVVMGGNWLFPSQKATLMTHLGFEGLPSLPEPSQSLSPDQQALYWAYALYDYQKFRTVYGTAGGADPFYAIDQARAKSSLQELIPEIGNATLGEISAYAPIGFRQVNSGGQAE